MNKNVLLDYAFWFSFENENEGYARELMYKNK